MNVRVVLIDDAKKMYEFLCVNDSSESRQLMKSVITKIDFLKLNPFYGDPISKKIIPSVYAVSNLWRIELSLYWRMLYTIKGNDSEVVCFVIAIIDHNKYDSVFGYRKR